MKTPLEPQILFSPYQRRIMPTAPQNNGGPTMQSTEGMGHWKLSKHLQRSWPRFLYITTATTQASGYVKQTAFTSTRQDSKDSKTVTHGVIVGTTETTNQAVADFNFCIQPGPTQSSGITYDATQQTLPQHQGHNNFTLLGFFTKMMGDLGMSGVHQGCVA